jgi:hypothetical protein
MKLTGPEAVPPPFRCSTEERMRLRLMPEPEPPLKIVPSDVPVEDRVHPVVHGEDEAGGGLLGDARHADVEPHRRVERGLLGDEEVAELLVEDPGLLDVDEVAALEAPLGDRVGDPVDDLAQGALALGRAGGAAEVLLGDDVRGVHRPGGGELDAELLEGDRPVQVVRDAGVAQLPLDLVVRVDALGREVAADADPGLLRSECHRVRPLLVVVQRWRGCGTQGAGRIARNPQVLWYRRRSTPPNHKM